MSCGRGRATLLFALLASIARPAAAEPSAAHVARYEIDVTPKGDVASFKVLIEYGDAETKSDGFKFLGALPVSKLRVSDDRKRPLRFLSIPQDGETKVTFDLPSGDAAHKTAILTFEQELDVASGWFERSADVAWAPKFRIPVHAMTVRTHGVEAGAPYRCVGEGSGRLCTRIASSPFGVSFDLGAVSVWRWILLLATFGVAGVFVAAVIVRKRDLLVAARGVVPPVAEVAYIDPGGYRAAPVLPKGGAVAPTLATEDLRAYRKRLVWAGIAAALPTVAMFAATGLMGSAHVFAALALVVGSAIFGTLVLREKPRGTLFALPIAGALFGVFGGLFGGAVGAVLGALFGLGTFGFAHLMAVIGGAIGGSSTWRGFSSGTSSWSSGSSSCGGGGGSSCGGGGGSSCGGGGGGGGGCGG